MWIGIQPKWAILPLLYGGYYYNTKGKNITSIILFVIAIWVLIGEIKKEKNREGWQ